MPTPQSPQMEARSQLPALLTRLNRALLTPYTTPSQGTALETYIQDHILTDLAIATLPAPNHVKGPISLDRTARGLTRSFFTSGRDRELGWLCRDLESEGVGIVWTVRERGVWTAVRKVVERLLVLPGEANGEGRREALVRTLRGWRGDEGWEVRTVDDVVSDGAGRRHVVGREIVEEVRRGRVFDWPPLLLVPAPTSVAPVPEKARVWSWPALRTSTNTNINAVQLDYQKRQRADRALALMDGTAKQQPWTRHVDTMAKLRGSNRDVGEDSQQTDDAQMDAAIRASLESAREEDRQRELEVIFAEKAERRILREEEKRRYQALGFVEDSDEEMEDEFGFEREVDEEGVADGAGGVGGDVGVEAPCEARGKGMGALGSSNGYAAAPSSTGSSSQSATDVYPCAVCSQSFRDAFALNEHYQQHFND